MFIALVATGVLVLPHMALAQASPSGEAQAPTDSASFLENCEDCYSDDTTEYIYYDYSDSVTIKDEHVNVNVLENGIVAGIGEDDDIYADAWSVAVKKNGKVIDSCKSESPFTGGGYIYSDGLDRKVARFDAKDHAQTSTSRDICGQSKILRVQHSFRSAKRLKGCQGAYEVKVTIQNRSCKSLEEILYRRQTDFDVGGTDNFFTFRGVTAKNPAVVQASNGLSCGGNLPGEECTPEAGPPEGGPFDQSSLFDISLGKLPKGKSVTFKMYYGSFSSREDAEKCVKGAKMTTHSYASGTDKTRTVLFGFRRNSVSLYRTKLKEECVQ